MKLFMFQVGGNFRNSNVELHDIRFSIGDKVEDCFADLRAQWWGDKAKFHVDCWAAIEQADGHDITLRTTAPEPTPNRLFFINLGGYDPAEFTEQHKNVLIVAEDANAAKAKALKLVKGWKQPHKDKLFEVDQAVDLSAALRQYGHFIHLTKASEMKPFEFTADYILIDKA
ncbi:DUF1543 domain-containing protein [Pleomorphomonas sp. PLEO]|uniref:DUF1543 domain-containing protein n=1 Tax=Pleomorphomonas sp. PLEO TaxID=3239306 RepID=UPI00351F4248